MVNPENKAPLPTKARAVISRILTLFPHKDLLLPPTAAYASPENQRAYRRDNQIIAFETNCLLGVGKYRVGIKPSHNIDLAP